MQPLPVGPPDQQASHAIPGRIQSIVKSCGSVCVTFFESDCLGLPPKHTCGSRHSTDLAQKHAGTLDVLRAKVEEKLRRG